MVRLAKIEQIAVNIYDMARAEAFYRDALGMQHLFSVPPNMTFFDCGGVRLMLTKASETRLDHPSSIIYFQVDDIHQACREMTERGVVFEREPTLAAKMEDGELWMAFFNDSEGNLLALSSKKPPA